MLVARLVVVLHDVAPLFAASEQLIFAGARGESLLDDDGELVDAGALSYGGRCNALI